VDHGCDWPETREYVAMLREKYPITVLKPNVGGFDNLYEFFWHHRFTPSKISRLCTDKFKVRVLHKYFESPCFVMIGIDAGESHRAKIAHRKGIENRWPLIEQEIDRQGCIEIIKSHNLPVPIKSGCWFCCFQRVSQWKDLRRKHPDLFCKAVQLEKRHAEKQKEKGERILTITGSPYTLDRFVDDRQQAFFEEVAYPPCQCGL
jgi:3'-phosphoadenosine 5'-phosphosulfate sulfotransferase (PAPS reductase)/FAD synthetase